MIYKKEIVDSDKLAGKCKSFSVVSLKVNMSDNSGSQHHK